MLFIDDRKCSFCADCEYWVEYTDYDEFWGDCSVGRVTRECDYADFDPEDPDCPMHDEWVELYEEEEEEDEEEDEEEEDDAND